MDKITFLASLVSRGTSGDIDFGTLRLLDDPRNDDYFQTESYLASAFGVNFEKERTKPYSAEVKLSNLPAIDKFLSAWDNSNYRITIEKVDEEPKKRIYEEEVGHATFGGDWHKGTRASCTTCGILEERNGGNSENTPRDIV